MDFPDPKYRKICSDITLQSKTQGFFSELADKVTKRVGREWLENVFQKQINDLERVRACFRDEKVKSSLDEAVNNVSPFYRKKCGKTAGEMKSEGDKCVKEGTLKKAILCYSQSVVRGESKDGDRCLDTGNTTLAAIIARAKVSLLLERYENCMKDLQLALLEGCQENMKYEIYSMMGWCYKCLGQDKKSKLSFNIALNLIEDRIKILAADKSNARKKERKKVLEVLYKAKSELSAKQLVVLKEPVTTPDVLYTTGTRPKLFGQASEKHKSASNAIGFKYTKEAGRFGVATEHIDTGSVLIVEEPYVACLLPDMFASHCHHCFNRLEVAVPCRTCSGLAFCSITCRDKACSTYHRYECKFMDLFIGSGMSVLAHLSLRIITQSGLEFFKVLSSKLDQATGLPKEDLNEDEKNYISIYNLVTLSHLRLNEDMFHRTIMAVFLVKCLKCSGFFGDENRKDDWSEDELLVISLILRHLQFAQFNAHEIYETRASGCNESRGIKVVYVGVGLYQTAALLNHDCSPNIIRYFHGKNIVMVSSKPIEAGDMVSENYGPIYTKRDLAARQRELTSRYWFQCKCNACLEQWPTFQELSDDCLYLKCSTKGCPQLFKQPKTSKKSELNPQCPRCLETIHMLAIRKRIDKLEKLFQKGVEYMDNNEPKKAPPLFTAYLDEIHKIASPPSKTIPLCQEGLRTCWSLTGNLWIVKD